MKKRKRMGRISTRDSRRIAHTHTASFFRFFVAWICSQGWCTGKYYPFYYEIKGHTYMLQRKYLKAIYYLILSETNFWAIKLAYNFQFLKNLKKSKKYIKYLYTLLFILFIFSQHIINCPKCKSSLKYHPSLLWFDFVQCMVLPFLRLWWSFCLCCCCWWCCPFSNSHRPAAPRPPPDPWQRLQSRLVLVMDPCPLRTLLLHPLGLTSSSSASLESRPSAASHSIWCPSLASLTSPLLRLLLHLWHRGSV